MPEQVVVPSVKPVAGSEVRLLGFDQPLKWQQTDKGILVWLPSEISRRPPCQYAWTFAFQVP